ncbi:hypothetical protein [Spirochaeta dissipatitropha]
MTKDNKKFGKNVMKSALKGAAIGVATAHSASKIGKPPIPPNPGLPGDPLVLIIGGVLGAIGGILIDAYSDMIMD